MSDTYYTLREDAPTWARELHDAHADEYSESNGMYVADDLADMVLDQMMGQLTSRYAERATIAALAGCFDRWELAASIDHGLRCADETMALECAYVGEMVMSPILAMMTGQSRAQMAGHVDAWDAVVDAVGDWDHDGPTEPTDDDPGAERVRWVHDDIVWYETWGHVDGVMWDSSGDAGMTWFYVREGER